MSRMVSIRPGTADTTPLFRAADRGMAEIRAQALIGLLIVAAAPLIGAVIALLTLIARHL